MLRNGLHVLIAVACVAATVSPAAAVDDPRIPPLTALVADDAGLCVELNGLSAQSRRFVKSELFRRLKRLPAVEGFVKSKDFQNIQAMRKHLEKLSGQPFDRLVDNLLGESVVLAVYPDRDKPPAGVLLTRTSGRKALDDALRLIELAEPGQTKDRLKYLGVEYHRLKRPAKAGRAERTLYYLQRNSVLALSDRENMIRKVIRLSKFDDKTAAKEKPLAGFDNYRAARKSLRGEPVVTAFLNPRRWDTTLKIPAAANDPLPLPATLWKSCRWIMASVRLDGGVVLDAVLDYDRGDLPSLLREAVERLADSPELLDRIPKTALVAFAGQFEPGVLRSVLHGLLAGDAGKPLRPVRASARALMRFDPIDDLLPRLKQGAALYVVAGEAGPAGIPFHALIAVSLAAEKKAAAAKPDKADWRHRVEAGLENLLRFVSNIHNLNAAKSGGNPKLSTVKSSAAKGVRVHWIDGLDGFQPAFGLTPACLVLATAPRLVNQFETTAPSDRLVNDPAFQLWQRSFFPDANQVLFLNAELLRSHLQRQRKAVVGFRVKHGGASSQAAEQELDAAIQVLGVVDGAFLAARIGRSQIRLTLGGVTKPVEKSKVGKSKNN